jgi:hypothetical protein
MAQYKQQTINMKVTDIDPLFIENSHSVSVGLEILSHRYAHAIFVENNPFEIFVKTQVQSRKDNTIWLTMTLLKKRDVKGYIKAIFYLPTQGLRFFRPVSEKEIAPLAQVLFGFLYWYKDKSPVSHENVLDIANNIDPQKNLEKGKA